MLLILLQFDFIGKRKHLPVHPDAHIPFLPKFFQKLLVGSFLLYSHWAQNHELRPVSQGSQGVYDLVHGLPLNRPTAVGAEGPACMGKKHAEIIMDFRHCTYGGFLVNGNGRRKAGYLVHIRLVHLS